MNGTIRCNKDGTVMNKKTGTCPKCGKIQCHIAVYWHEQLHRYYKDSDGTIFTLPTATFQLANMNREMRDKTFKADAWQPGTIKNRKLEHAIEQWLDKIKKKVDQNELSYGTYNAYRRRIRTHILHPEYGLGSWDIREISYAELEEFQDNLPARLKINTRRAIMVLLKTFLTSVLKKFNLLPPPFPDTISGDDATERFALTLEDQIEALKKIPAEHRDFYEFEMETGVRPGEACALKIMDLKTEDRTIKIHRTLTEGRIRESDKEGHKAFIPLTARAFAIAQKHAQGRFPDDWLFIHPGTKRHYALLFLSKTWKKYTGLPITHYEGTRHSFGTQIAEKNDIRIAQKLLRHATSKSTERYVHERTEYLRAASERRTNVVDLNKAKEQKG